MRSRGNEFLPKAKTRRASASVVQFIDFASGLIKKARTKVRAFFIFYLRSRGNEFLPKAKTRRASVSVVQFIDFASGLR